MRHWSIHRIFILALTVAGCASTAPRPGPAPQVAPLFADAAFGAPSEPVGADDLFTLSAAMRAYLHSAGMSRELRQKGAVEGLVEALYRKSELKLQYDSSRTRTAAQTFEARAGNCLSLVVMTAAFARELGLPVQFQSVGVDDSWSRNGGLYLVSSHINLSLRAPAAEQLSVKSTVHRYTVDFLAPDEANVFSTVPLEEGDVAAMYMNNRAAEALVAGRVDDAYWWARTALAQHPGAIQLYNTLAVIYQRHGDLALAETVFRTALAREPENLVVMRNLEPLLALLGKKDEAAALARQIAAIDPSPPFHFFNIGVKAYERGDYPTAKAMFAREVKRVPYYDEFHFWLAVTCLRLGQQAQAREQLALAVDNSTRPDNRQLYAAKLQHLRSLSSRM